MLLIQNFSSFTDPHTAVGVHVANQLFASSPSTPVIVSSTAHWAKFPNAMCLALGKSVPQADAIDLKRMLRHVEEIAPETYRKGMHREIAKLVELPTLHDEHCAAEMTTVVEHIKAFLQQFAARIAIAS